MTTRQTADRRQAKSHGKPGFKTSRRAVAFLLTSGLFSVATSGFSAVNNVNVKLAWNASATAGVAGYRIYYGGASGNYTNSLTVGNVTTGTISNLSGGRTYYFATKAYNTSGTESSFSNEIAYTTPGGGANLRLLLLPNRQVALTINGTSGRTYQIQASTNLSNWSTLRTVTLGTTGSTNYTDTSAPSYARRFYRTQDTTP